jgi:hypothetical protein
MTSGYQVTVSNQYVGAYALGHGNTPAEAYAHAVQILCATLTRRLEELMGAQTKAAQDAEAAEQASEVKP